MMKTAIQNVKMFKTTFLPLNRSDEIKSGDRDADVKLPARSATVLSKLEFAESILDVLIQAQSRR